MTIIYTIPAVRNAWADLASLWNGTTGDIADPGNTLAAAGWTKSTLPPQYQYFNWILNYCSAAVRYFMQNGIVDWQTGELYQQGACVVQGGWVYQSLTNNNTGNSPAGALGTNANWAPLAGYATIAMLAPFITSTELTAALAPYASKNSPTLTGNPLSVTPPTADSSQSIATTAFTKAAIAAALGVYLTSAQAAALYLTIGNAAATYLTIGNAAATYLTQSAAASTYATQALVTSGATKAAFVRQVNPSGTIYLDGVTPSLAQGANTVAFPVAFPGSCVSVSLTPFGNSATYALTSVTPGHFTLNTGAAVPFHYHAAGF